jgi:hypothetical protein
MNRSVVWFNNMTLISRNMQVTRLGSLTSLDSLTVCLYAKYFLTDSLKAVTLVWRWNMGAYIEGRMLIGAYFLNNV